MTDTLDTILSLARAVQATPEQLARAAALLNAASSTLREEVTAVEAAGRPAQDSYSPARRRILSGEPASEAPWERPGFGPRRRATFTAPQAAARQDLETARAVRKLLLRRAGLLGDDPLASRRRPPGPAERHSRVLSPDELIEYMHLVFTHSRGPARDAWMRLLRAPRGGTR